MKKIEKRHDFFEVFDTINFDIVKKENPELSELLTDIEVALDDKGGATSENYDLLIKNLEYLEIKKPHFFKKNQWKESNLDQQINKLITLSTKYLKNNE